MGNEQTPDEYPDTTRSIGELVGPAIDRLVDRASASPTPELLRGARERAERMITTQRTDRVSELAGAKADLVTLGVEHSLHPELGVRDALDEANRTIKATGEELGSLPPE